MGKDLKGKELGTGISQRKDGLYIARYTTRFGKRTPPMYAKTEREIKKKYRDAKYEDEHGIGSADPHITLDEWYNTWEALYGSDQLKPSTLRGYRCHYNAQIKPYLGAVQLLQLTPLMVRQWMKERRAAGIVSIHTHLSTLKTVLRDAKVAGLIQQNPAQDIVGISHVAEKTIALTKRQLHNLIENFSYESNHRYAEWLLVIRFLALTGYRFGELAGLRWSDIDWKNNIIYVRRTAHHKYGTKRAAYYTTPKTANSVRSTPLSPQLKEILMTVMQLQTEWMKKNEEHWKRTDESVQGLVFTTMYGGPLNNGSFNDMLKIAIPRINEKLPPEDQIPMITAHCFRDTFASLCYEMKIPLKEVQELMGHGEQAMTLYYTQVDQKQVQTQLEHIHASIGI